MVLKTTGMRFAAISRIYEDRWIACAVNDQLGLELVPGKELRLENTPCKEVSRTKNPIFIRNLKENGSYSDHPVFKQYGIQSYLSLPVLKQDGSFFGTLCAFDTLPATPDTPKVLESLRLFSDLISRHLEAIEKSKDSSDSSTHEKERLLLREDVLSRISHDLRNPIATIRMSAEILSRMASEAMARRQASIILSGSYRISGLLDDFLDLVRIQCGEGLLLNIHAHQESLEKALNQVIKEYKITAPDSLLESEFKITQPVPCDPNRLVQLCSNLLSNAILHGKKDQAVQIYAGTTSENFQLKVSNTGTLITDTGEDQLFEPFYSTPTNEGRNGLGLGLFIAREIARAHKGRIELFVAGNETCFTFSMPISSIK